MAKTLPPTAVVPGPTKLPGSAARNITLYPWFRVFQNLVFWQAVWFLFFQARLSAAEAVLIYAIYDVSTTILEVPSGYLSDRVGRRFTLIASALCLVLAAGMQVSGESFAIFALAQVFLGAGMAFSSGTDSALLYETLVEEGRGDEVEAQELRAWRFSFAALALSAVIGGASVLIWDRLPFLLTMLAYLGMVVVTLRFHEPRHRADTIPQGDEMLRFGTLRAALLHPVLMWLFAVTMLMYGFSHLPFVFGQPFIFDALQRIGWAAEAPLVSGAVSACMMLISLGASLYAPGLRRKMGLAGIILLAFGLQIAIVGVLALTSSAIAIGVLFLRMVPDSLSRAFILARVQPLLGDEARATYLSLKSLAGRMLFAGSLWLASRGASDVGTLAHTELSRILGWYVAAGVTAWLVLWWRARWLAMDVEG